MRILGSFLAGRRPDQACLALRHLPFREAMQHGIDPAARWVVNLTLRRPLAALQGRLALDAARGGVAASAVLPFVSRLTPALAELSRVVLLARRHPEILDAALLAVAVSEWVAEHHHELVQIVQRARRGYERARRALGSLLGSPVPR